MVLEYDAVPGGVGVPERVECSETSGRLLAHTQSTRLTFLTSSASFRVRRQRLLNEVCLEITAQFRLTRY